MPEVFYLIPKTGSGVDEDAIRPSYMNLIKGSGFNRCLDDPFSYTSGVGLYALLDPSPDMEALLEKQIGVVKLGTSPQLAVATMKQRAANDLRVSDWFSKYPTDKALEDGIKVRRTPLPSRIGTDTTIWTGTNGDPWTGLAANPLTKVFISGTDGKATYDVLSNTGQITQFSGGASYSAVDLWHQTTNNAEDQTVKFHHLSGVAQASHKIAVSGRVVVGDTDTFFNYEQIDQGGDDRRLHEVVDGVSSLLVSLDLPDINAGLFMKITIKTNTGDSTKADIDCVAWTDGGGEPSADITFSNTVSVALQGKSGYGGILVTGKRNGTAMTLDDLEFTDDDVAAGDIVVLRRRIEGY